MSGRRCVFCGATNVSKEHVIPRWVAAALPRPGGSGPPWRHSDDNQAWAADHLSFTVKRVCRDCNHGWMNSKIEEPARPSLISMIQGREIDLTSEDQQHVAAWAVKTHAMAQFRRADARPLTEELRSSLYEKQLAPLRSRVWLAAFVGDPEYSAWGRTTNFQLLKPADADTPEDLLDGEMFTLCMGHLVLQSFKWAGPQQFQLTLGDQVKPFLVPIWPRQGGDAHWPGEWSIDNPVTLKKFAEWWVDTGPPPV